MKTQSSQQACSIPGGTQIALDDEKIGWEHVLTMLQLQANELVAEDKRSFSVCIPFQGGYVCSIVPFMNP
jgi:hypothetical protein